MLNNFPDKVCDAAAEEVMDALTRLFNKAAIIEREPVDTGDGILLHTSEIHLIDAAGRFPDAGMSALASRLGITKGAVSQTAKKLEEKGYLIRVSVEGNNKTVLIRLTDAGTRAFHWHRVYHARVNERLARVISGLESRDREKLRKIFVCMEKIFDNCPETRAEITRKILEDTSGRS